MAYPPNPAPVDHDEVLTDILSLVPQVYPGASDLALLGMCGSPLGIGTNTVTVGLAGRQRLARVRLPAATVTNLHVGIRSSGSGFGTGNVMGLYNSAGTQLRVTGDTAAAFASGGHKQVALTSPVAVTAGYYYVAILTNASGLPTMMSPGSENQPDLVNSLGTSSTRVYYTNTSTLTALPATYTYSSLGGSANGPWVGVS